MVIVPRMLYFYCAAKTDEPRITACQRESDTRFSTSGFFHESVTPGPMSTPLGLFRIFSKIREDILEWMFITGVNDTGDKLFTGVKNTGDKVMAGVNDTGD